MVSGASSSAALAPSRSTRACMGLPRASISCSLAVARGDVDGLVGALRRLARSPEERVRFGAAGRAAAVERFDRRPLCDAFIEALEAGVSAAVVKPYVASLVADGTLQRLAVDDGVRRSSSSRASSSTARAPRPPSSSRRSTTCSGRLASGLPGGSARARSSR
jgi:hypothetical protein